MENRYEVKKQKAQGAFGVCYRVRDRTLTSEDGDSGAADLVCAALDTSGDGTRLLDECFAAPLRASLRDARFFAIFAAS